MGSLKKFYKKSLPEMGDHFPFQHYEKPSYKADGLVNPEGSSKMGFHRKQRKAVSECFKC